MADVKIATCTFCGTRAALVLRGRERHELACASCGAPLHDLKMLPKRPEPAPRDTRAHAAIPAGSHQRAMSRKPAPAPKRPNKTKSFARRAFAEIWDVIEDIID